MTSSTISSESAPRSSTNDALLSTWLSSTPSCSTMICLTFCSTADAIRPPIYTEAPAGRGKIFHHPADRQAAQSFDSTLLLSALGEHHGVFIRTRPGMGEIPHRAAGHGGMACSEHHRRTRSHSGIDAQSTEYRRGGARGRELRFQRSAPRGSI